MAKRRSPPTKPARSADPAAKARDAVAHLPVDPTGRVKLTLALSLERAAVERLSALAIARGRNLEDLAAEILGQAARG